MSGASGAIVRRCAWRLALFVGVVAAAACVEIATGPSGVASIRLLPAPRAIITGDDLRDSTGAVTRLGAVAFGDHGDTIKDAPFRFTALAITRDTTAASRVVPLVVDSVTGAVRALTVTSATRARLAVRLGDRLQVLDTITVVKRPTRLAREGTSGDSLQTMDFLCSDTGRAATPIAFPGENPPRPIGNALQLSVALTADSTATARAAVPGYYVRFDIVSPTNIPTTTFRGVARPAISIISDLNVDRPTNTDTTETSGIANAYLRVSPAGLGPPAFSNDFTVTVRASARTSPTDVVPSPVLFVVSLRRRTTSPGSGDALTGPGCGR